MKIPLYIKQGIQYVARNQYTCHLPDMSLRLSGISVMIKPKSYVLRIPACVQKISNFYRQDQSDTDYQIPLIIQGTTKLESYRTKNMLFLMLNNTFPFGSLRKVTLNNGIVGYIGNGVAFDRNFNLLFMVLIDYNIRKEKPVGIEAVIGKHLMLDDECIHLRKLIVNKLIPYYLKWGVSIGPYYGNVKFSFDDCYDILIPDEYKPQTLYLDPTKEINSVIDNDFDQLIDFVCP